MCIHLRFIPPATVYRYQSSAILIDYFCTASMRWSERAAHDCGLWQWVKKKKLTDRRATVLRNWLIVLHVTRNRGGRRPNSGKVHYTGRRRRHKSYICELVDWDFERTDGKWCVANRFREFRCTAEELFFAALRERRKRTVNLLHARSGELSSNELSFCGTLYIRSRVEN